MSTQAYYLNFVNRFINEPNSSILGKLNLRGTEFVSQFGTSTISWDNSIYYLKEILTELSKFNPRATNWTVLLEYEIPRLGSRADIILLSDDLIFLIEYKDDRRTFNLADQRQVESYALDLAYFHLESRDRKIFPVLWAPFANEVQQELNFENDLGICECVKVNNNNIAFWINKACQLYHNELNKQIDPILWDNSEYKPTPTIVEAAKALYSGHRVEDITRKDAENLSSTTQYLVDAINSAIIENKKIVCFVTGVPGAGKTLVGLNLINEQQAIKDTKSDSAYFSGNVPLISVLCEALIRDKMSQEKALQKRKDITRVRKKYEIEKEVKAKIQNLHLFIKNGLRTNTPPAERVVVFDEAQRCWTAEHFKNKSARNANREVIPVNTQQKSEAEFLFEYMGRWKGWAVIVALVGNGQEINTGEAGIQEWGRVLNSEKFLEWEVRVSPEMLDGENFVGDKLFSELDTVRNKIVDSAYLHLKTSQRSIRTTNLNKWVDLILNNRHKEAKVTAIDLKDVYPIYVTRDLEQAKEWLKNKMLGEERIGFVASSGGQRLRPFGFFVKEGFDVPMWFLNSRDDVRSSSFLEIAATEFAVQGLELDWVGLAWDADLRRGRDDWKFYDFNGTKWQNVHSLTDRRFMLNTYRVLLTRARKGMIIFVPPGEIEDPTRLPEYYDGTYEYLIECGATAI